MTRMNPTNKDNANPKVKEIFQKINTKLGKVPNIFLNLGNSEAALSGYMGLSESVSKTSLDPKLIEKLALVVGQTNNCHYCLSAHSVIAKGLGIEEADIIKAREAHANDAKSEAILQFAKNVVQKRGLVSDQEVSNLKAAGVNDKELAEIILIISLNIFTNYFNHITGTKIDFPLAPELSLSKR
jgi:uncharacterized peroxidase-related enzyme